MESDLASRTVERATAALQSSRIACLPEIVKLLRTLAGKTEDVSVMELAEVIQNDAVVMTKVIGAANTFHYNPNSVPVSNVIQAIHVIGYERIRSLAMSLMLAEQAARGQSAEEQREVAAKALMAGCFAQAIAGTRALLDPEQAFVCGCLRSFGHVVLASCMVEDYRQARTLTLTASWADDDAYRQVFGLTPLELGHLLLKASNLPAEILATLRALPPEALAALDTRPEAQMLALAECADQLARLTCDARVPTEEYAARSAAVVQRFKNVLPHLGDEVPGLVQAATHQLDSLAHTFRLRNLPPQVLAHARSCRRAVERDWAEVRSGLAGAPRPREVAPVPLNAAAPTELPAPSVPPFPDVLSVETRPGTNPATPPAAATTPLAAVPTPPATGATAAAPALVLPEHDWQGSIGQLATLLCAPEVSQETLQRTLVEVVSAGLGAQECLFFAAAPRHRGFALLHGTGRLFAHCKDRPEVAVHAGDRTVFGVCLQRKENVNIHHAHDARIGPYLPDWLKGRAELGAFVLLPFTDGSSARGVILAGWPAACQIALPASCTRALRTTIALVFKAQLKLAA